jgi:Tol biopolymer transport system component
MKRFAYAVAAVAALAVGLTALAALSPRFGIGSGPTPTEEPSVDFGIFAPVAGRIVSGLWAIDPIAVDPSAVNPSAPSSSTQVRLGSEEVLPLGWSSDGTELLFMREDPTDQTFPHATHLYILRADGTETQLTRDAMEIRGAAISPDGSRVVYSSDGLHVVDAEGGQPVRIADEGASPTFSPDGTQIAYLVTASGPGEAHVWVADADGSDAHEILADEPALVVGADELAWSPAGDRIAIGNSLEGRAAIYTFAPDGSDFTKVITGGINAFWSPDGSQIAYTRPYDGPRPGLAIANADGSNVREFGFAASGPWHPGTPESAPERTSSSSAPSPPPLTEAFSSAVHGISIDYPAGWQTRPATEPWNQEVVTFGAPDVDAIFDPTLQDDLYFALVSEPLNGKAADDWCCGDPLGAAGMCSAGSDMGTYTLDGARGWHPALPR